MGWMSAGLRLVAAFVLGTATIGGGRYGQAFAVQGRAPGVWPKHARLAAMTCPTITVCFAVGENTAPEGQTVTWRGFIANTDDSGRTWTVQYLDSRYSFLQIACPTATRCYATGSLAVEGTAHNTILRTKDGGRTWHPPAASLPADGKTSEYVGGIACLTATTCLVPTVLIYPPPGQPQRTLMLMTTDGGRTWSKSKRRVAVFPSVGSSIACPTTQVCYLKGSIPGTPPRHGAIVTTRDGGNSWRLLPGTDVLAGLSLPDGYESGSIACPSVNVCYTQDGWPLAGCIPPCGPSPFGSIVGTQDGFTHWRTLYLRRTRVHLVAPMVCPGAAVCYAMGDSNVAVANGEFILSTKNAGQTWTKHMLPAGTALACPTIDTCYVAHGTTISRTSDGGTTWQTLS